MEIDWLNERADVRLGPTKALYLVLRDIEKAQSDDFLTLVVAALGSGQGVTDSWIGNFRKGKIDAGKARRIHSWLKANHFAEGRAIAPDLFQDEPDSAWQRFVDRNAITGRLHIRRITKDVGIVQRARDVQDAAVTIRLGEEFILEVETELDGIALGFQCHKDVWHIIPLGPDDRNPRKRVKAGTVQLPAEADGTPIPLVELHDTGPHQFIVLVMAEAPASNDMRKLATLDRNLCGFEVHLGDVRILA